MSFEFEGVGAFQKALQELVNQMERAAVQALTDETKHVLEKSRSQVNVRTGKLRRSGKRGMLPRRKKGRVEAYVGYGDKRTWYARIHEAQEPYLEPALDRTRYRERVERAVSLVITRAGR